MNTSVSKIMSKLVLADKTVNIKLLGDSITHGVGGTGFQQNGEHIAGEFFRNPNGYCWAKLFKDYMESHFDCVVTNNGCTGTNIEFVIDNFETLVDDKDDIVICTIGTNNRHQYFADGPKRTSREHMQNFYNNILKLHGLFKDAGKDVIFVANIPASAENEKDGEDYWRLFHLNDVNNLYTKAAAECGFPFISMYNLFYDYCDIKGITVDSLLVDGLHPSDKGYEVFFSLIMKALGIARQVE